MPKHASQPAPPPAPPAPAGISERSRAIWESVVPRRARSPERLALLEVALRARDRLEQIEGILRTEGLTLVHPKSGGQRLNPLLRAETVTRRQLLRAWSALSLEWNPLLDSRVS